VNWKSPFHAEPRHKQLLEYTVGVIEFQTDSDSEATELFIRFNSTGKKLTKSDLFLAELAVKVEGLTRIFHSKTEQRSGKGVQ
jgi:uncharacterized protein with ParB-like and HNH nuclease domain